MTFGTPIISGEPLILSVSGARHPLRDRTVTRTSTWRCASFFNIRCPGSPSGGRCGVAGAGRQSRAAQSVRGKPASLSRIMGATGRQAGWHTTGRANWSPSLRSVRNLYREDRASGSTSGSREECAPWLRRTARRVSRAPSRAARPATVAFTCGGTSDRTSK
jgi:hypothetical protein